jgi:hypothetical protein
VLRFAREKSGQRIVSARTAGGRSFAARVFIDVSYEGDLLKLAGCSYTSRPRKLVAIYNEPLARVRFPPSRLGQADDKLQAFDYGLCLTDARENQVPFRPPPCLAAGRRPPSASMLAALIDAPEGGRMAGHPVLQPTALWARSRQVAPLCARL